MSHTLDVPCTTALAATTTCVKTRPALRWRNDLEHWVRLAQTALAPFGVRGTFSPASAQPRVLCPCSEVLLPPWSTRVTRGEWPPSLRKETVAAVAAGANGRGAIWLACVAPTPDAQIRVLVPIPLAQCQRYQGEWAARTPEVGAPDASDASDGSDALDLSHTYQRMRVAMSSLKDPSEAEVQALLRIFVPSETDDPLSAGSHGSHSSKSSERTSPRSAPSTPNFSSSQGSDATDDGDATPMPPLELPEAHAQLEPPTKRRCLQRQLYAASLGTRYDSDERCDEEERSADTDTDVRLSIPSDGAFLDPLVKRVWDSNTLESKPFELSASEVQRLREMLDPVRTRDLIAVERGSMAGLRGAVIARRTAARAVELGRPHEVEDVPTPAPAPSTSDAVLEPGLEAAFRAYQPLSEFASAASASIKRATPLIRPLLTNEMIRAYRQQLVARQRRIAELERRVGPARAPRAADEATLSASWAEARMDAVAIALMRQAQAARAPMGDENAAARLRGMCVDLWERHFMQFAEALGRQRSMELIRGVTDRHT